MKKFIALTALLSMSVAFADDVVYGTFVLNSSEPEIVLCVPWVNPGSTDGSIPVTDLIQTSTLKEGDLLYYYSGSYKAWRVNSSKQWEGSQVVKTGENDKTTIEASAGTGETLSRGNAVILKRDMTKSGRSNEIIINGQVGGDFSGISIKRTSGVLYSLIAPPNPDAATSLSTGTWTGLKDDDCVFVGMKPYYYKDGTWGERKGALEKDSSGNIVRGWVPLQQAPSIPAGKGAWLVTQGEGEDVTWKLQ